MTNDQIIRELEVVKDYFISDRGASPVCIDEAIRVITSQQKRIIRDKKNLMDNKSSGGFECFNCRQKSVSWDSDFSFEDFGYEGEGIVHAFHCNNCRAEIFYTISFDEEEED